VGPTETGVFLPLAQHNNACRAPCRRAEPAILHAFPSKTILHTSVKSSFELSPESNIGVFVGEDEMMTNIFWAILELPPLTFGFTIYAE
jgi:hypothetical protein